MRGVRVRRRGFSVDSAASTAGAASVPVLGWSSVMIKIIRSGFLRRFGFPGRWCKNLLLKNACLVFAVSLNGRGLFDER
jgi:hypothetical protein